MGNTTPTITQRLYTRFHRAFSSILSSYTCPHLRIIRLHLTFYFSNLNRPPTKKGHIPHLWARTYYALQEAISRGDLLPHPEDKNWLFLPGTDSSTLHQKYKHNSSTYRIWTEKSHDLGTHSEVTIRNMLNFKGFRQPKTPPTFFLGAGQEVQPDAYTLTPIRAAFEVKNGLSEVWPDPRTIKRPSADHIQVLKHFQMCKENALTPVFVAVKLDPTFYDFAAENSGLCFELGFQIFPTYLSHISKAVALDLGFRNIVLAPENPPYPHEFDPFLRWLDAIKP